MGSLLGSLPKVIYCAEQRPGPSAGVRPGANGSLQIPEWRRITSHARRVEDVMTREVVSVEELASLGEIAELMETKRIKRVPVVHDGKIVGIVTRADLLQVLASGGAASADEESDRLIRDRLLAELRRQEWANSAEGNVVVSEGVVHFCGTVGSEEERRALRVVAENIPGVRGIEDHTISGPRYLAPLFPTV